MRLPRSLTIILTSFWIVCGCASPERVDRPIPVAPPFPESYRGENFRDYYPDASRRARETGEIIVELSLAPDGKVQTVAVDDQRSAPFPRLAEGAQKVVHGMKFLVGDSYKKLLTMSIVFDISPCGKVIHSPGADYDINICVDPRPVNYEPWTIHEFVGWFQALDSKLSREDRRLVRIKMNRYASSVRLSPLGKNSPDELRVWVGRGGQPAIAGFIVSNKLARRCTLSSSSGRAHCTDHKLDSSKRYFSPLKGLERFNGHRYLCNSTYSLTPESDAYIDDANIDIEWVDGGKRFAVHSNDLRVGACSDKPSSLITKVIESAGWKTLP
jgi:TonB family protein